MSGSEDGRARTDTDWRAGRGAASGHEDSRPGRIVLGKEDRAIMDKIAKCLPGGQWLPTWTPRRDCDAGREGGRNCLRNYFVFWFSLAA